MHEKSQYCQVFRCANSHPVRRIPTVVVSKTVVFGTCEKTSDSPPPQEQPVVSEPVSKSTFHSLHSHMSFDTVLGWKTEKRKCSRQKSQWRSWMNSAAYQRGKKSSAMPEQHGCCIKPSSAFTLSESTKRNMDRFHCS